MGLVESEASGKDLPKGAKLWLNVSRFDEPTYNWYGERVQVIVV